MVTRAQHIQELPDCDNACHSQMMTRPTEPAFCAAEAKTKIPEPMMFPVKGIESSGRTMGEPQHGGALTF